jgi:hypothetical protein
LHAIALEAPIPRRSDSENCIQKILEWVQECEQRHQGCSPPSFTPTRLLDVNPAFGEVDYIKLIENESLASKNLAPEAKPYIALSHCWGKTLQITTTIAKNSQRKEGILLSDLSKTFRDAVEITRRLGIRYLWIDALCIIQDDGEEWAREASSMSRIYSGAYLTIAAATAHDGSAGIFSDRLEHMREIKVETMTGKPVRMVVVPDDVAKSRFFDHRAFGGLVWLDEEDLGESLPLVTRAWTFQERLLSRRVVHFAKSEMVFECNNGFSCECKAQMHQAGIRQILNGISDSPSVERVLQETWWAIVMQYSSLEMSVRGDVLPALGGIARLFEEAARNHGVDLGEYCAGMWRRWLSSSLLWKQRVSRHETQEGNTFAPSWSWASATGNFAVSKLEEGLQWSLVIHGYDSQPAYDDPFGRLTKADLVVESSLIPTIYDSATWPNAYLHTDPLMRLYIRFDHNKKQISGERLFCMEAAVDLRRMEPLVHGLVLIHKRREDASVYERVGTFDSERKAIHAFGYRFIKGGWTKIELKTKMITLV